MMMNLERDLVFCYIEEDNIQRAYFRVRPLLTVHGNVQQEAASLWPDNGCLRIVPDRNEQHTFKERMRTLGGYCMMNLQGIPADANKIRTNKNYKPDRGETNQFILYSDTVQALPEHTFYEVIEAQAEAYAAAAEKAATPLFYIREGDTLYGPVRKAAPDKPSTATQAAGVLYPLTLPNGEERVILVIPQTAELPAPAPAPAAEEALPIGKPLQILDQTKSHEQTLQSLDQPLSSGANLLRQQEEKPTAPVMPVQDKPLTGTPLFRSPMHTSVPQPKNKLQEVIHAQWRVARNEPPTAPLPAGAKLHQVENPVEIACASMRNAWQVPEAQTQLIDFLLSLDGMRAKLEPRLMEAAGGSSLQKALQNRLQDMEAERLTVLLQLDKAKADLEGFRRSTLDALSDKTKAESNRLLAEKGVLEQSISQLKTQLAALLAQREELTRRVDDLQHATLPAALSKALADAQLSAPVNGIPLRLCPVSGESVNAEALLRRMQEVFAACGTVLQRNHAATLLVLLAICPRIGVVCSTPAPAATLLSNAAASMGWQGSFAHQVTPEQKTLLSPAPASATPAVLLTSLAAYAPLSGITKILLSKNVLNLTRNPAFEANSWPVLPLPQLPALALYEGSAVPVSSAALKALIPQTINKTEFASLFSPILAAAPALSGAALAEMQQFVAAAAQLMEGGLPAACDWAILLWILPLAEGSAKAALKPLLQEYPHSLAALQA